MLRLSKLFSDHAVLQCDRAIPVWGWSEPFEIIEGSLGGVKCMTRAGDDGKFELRFPPRSEGGPVELEVRDLTTGEKVLSRDIWIGEVWVASGQSNMQFSVDMLRTQCQAVQQEAGSFPRLRMMTLPRRAQVGSMTDPDADWQVSTAESVASWSAVGYFFGRELHRSLEVPVGIIASSWSGTVVEAWLSRQALSRNPDLASKLEQSERRFNSPKTWKEASAVELSVKFLPEQESELFRSLLPECPDTLDSTGRHAVRDLDDSNWALGELPCSWSELGLQVNGVVWFRREIEIPEAWVGCGLQLDLGMIDKHDVTYFNGIEVGRTGSGFELSCSSVLRSYRIPAELVNSGRAVIAVRNYSFAYDGGLLGSASGMRIMPLGGDEQDSIPLAGVWKYQVGFQYPKFSTNVRRPGWPNSYTRLFENMIRPLIPMAIRGVIWYQGENNVDFPDHYERVMTDLIQDWRYQWGQGDFPFLQVVLAGFHESSIYDDTAHWPYLREAQSQAAKRTGNLIASALDLGEAEDIHPQRKEEVGKRLALAALEQAYKRPITGSGPVYRDMIREGKSILVRFDQVGAGLRVNGDELRGFVIAGLDGIFQEAQAQIIGNAVRVFSPAVEDPVAVRYAWSDNPDMANLGNEAGLPAIPFRTDNYLRKTH